VPQASSDVHSPIIVALDVDSPAAALSLVDSIGDAVSFYKVGLELYAAAGMPFVRELKSRGLRVFLDLKLYDIGETVKRAVAQIATNDIDLLTVHAMRPVMAAAVEGRGASALGLLGVTVLTSFDEADLKNEGYALNLAELVELRVRHAVETKMDGIVCSALEISRVRAVAGNALKLVVPGVRSAGAAVGDQKRVATPKQALADGATYLVIGREITRASDPRAAAQRIHADIQGEIAS
jgi:orotidine-5'-phosphate decarboxylase